MEQLIRRVAEALDRRSFVRNLGKVGMWAAAVAGVLLLPRRASAIPGCTICQSDGTHSQGQAPCNGLRPGDPCRAGKSRDAHICVGYNDPANGDCGCDCVLAVTG